MLEHFRRWLVFNLRYFRRPPWDTGVTPPELAAFCAAHPAGKALELGCGTGTNVAFLARRGWQVSGVDFALRAVTTARRKLVWEGLRGEVLLEDASKVQSFGGGYDLVLDIGCLHGLGSAERARYLGGLPGLLAPGGSYLLYAHLKGSPPAAVGLEESEIRALGGRLRQVSRSEGTDRGERRSVWLEFRREAL